MAKTGRPEKEMSLVIMSTDTSVILPQELNRLYEQWKKDGRPMRDETRQPVAIAPGAA